MANDERMTKLEGRGLGVDLGECRPRSQVSGSGSHFGLRACREPTKARAPAVAVKRGRGSVSRLQAGGPVECGWIAHSPDLHSSDFRPGRPAAEVRGMEVRGMGRDETRGNCGGAGSGPGPNCELLVVWIRALSFFLVSSFVVRPQFDFPRAPLTFAAAWLARLNRA